MDTDKKTLHKTLNIIQFCFEISIILGYVLGILGGLVGLYYVVMLWVIPFTIANLVFSLITDNKTTFLTVPNIVMSFVTLIPILGFFSALIGIVLSSINVFKLTPIFRDFVNSNPENTDSAQPGDSDTQTIDAVVTQKSETQTAEADATSSEVSPEVNTDTETAADTQPDELKSEK